MSSLEPDSIISELSRFLSHTPQLIRKYANDYERAYRLERLTAQDESPFTLAVVGQMRSGKSTLINSILDDDDVTIVGVNETTATVNWILHGDTPMRDMFRVTWNESPLRSEILARSELVRWSGDSRLAETTRYIELFSTSNFLKNVVIVDTPGSRSTIESHQETLESFIAARQRCENETLYYGGEADCMVYVLPATARQSDSELLRAFSEETRIPGSSVFNSIGVLHKWEAMIASDSPWNDAQRKAVNIRSQLKNYLSDVIPVSGPLHRLSNRMPDSFWEEILRLATACQPSTFKRLTMQDRYFLDWEPSPESEDFFIVGTPKTRRDLFTRSQLPWSCFKVVLQFARQTADLSAQELKKSIRQLAGIDQLISILESRFFSRAKTIRASTRLRKSLLPCDEVIRQLRLSAYNLSQRMSMVEQALDEVATKSTELPNCKLFLDEEKHTFQKRLLIVQRGLEELESASNGLREQYLKFDQDMQAIKLLDENPGLFSSAEALEIFSVIGAYGNRLEQRCSIYQHWQADPSILEERLNYWISRFETTVGTERRILACVVNRLDEILAAAFPNLHLEAI